MMAVWSYCWARVLRPWPSSKVSLPCWPPPFCFWGLGMGVMNSARRRVAMMRWVGWPVAMLWNVVVLFFYLLNTGWLINLITVLVLAVLTFIPVKFVHPLRVTRWREVTIPMTVLWAAMTLSLVISSKDKGPTDTVYLVQLWLWGAASLYFAGISLWRTFTGVDHEDEA